MTFNITQYYEFLFKNGPGYDYYHTPRYGMKTKTCLRQGEPKEDALRKLFVGGLSRETTDDDFRGYFGDFGDITDSVIIRDQEGRSK